jgi:hypothetical protein
MKMTLCLLLLSTSAMVGLAQSIDNISARYQQLVENSQTFKDYKVIKKTTLDAFWKSVEDSLTSKALGIQERDKQIASLNNKLGQIDAAIQKREAAVAAIEYDSSHITVAGISFHKAAFISLMGIVLGCLVFAVISIFTRLQLVAKAMREKKEALLVLSSEYEEYKHRAVEKQMKLSRELQNERNRMAELQHHEMIASVATKKK